MPLYTVHIYAIVRVTCQNIGAPSEVDAIAAAENSLDLHSFLDRGCHVEYADENEGYVVDTLDNDTPSSVASTTSFDHQGKEVTP